ncbi:hypothetical protein LJR027_000266 [Terrabacter sp. LjRoot27]|uniref:hypothetical protein n=1 Tax=Terrabacter sp. LjRoot27 TaxID=3342306 RepID=UPI003ECE6717
MTALTTIPAPGHGAPRPHLVDVPMDYRLHGRGRRRDSHRFPAATYLCRSVAREERAIAQEALDATDRSASRRIGGLGGVVALLFVAVLALLATGRADTRAGVLTLVALGGLLVVVIVVLVAVLRSHEREHDVLAERVRMYDARLLELRPRR